MLDHTRAYLGRESASHVAAAAVLAGLVPADFEFIATAQMVYANLPDAALHLDGQCTTGRFTRVTGTELVQLATSPFNPQRFLCSKCTDVLQAQVPDADKMPHATLQRLAGAIRLTAELAELAEDLAVYPGTCVYLGMTQADQKLRTRLIHAVGQARALFAQDQTRGPRDVEEGVHQVFTERAESLRTTLAQVTGTKTWCDIEAYLTREAVEDFDWMIISADRPATVSQDAVRIAYDRAVELFAAGATLEAYAPAVGRPMCPVLRYRHGTSLPPSTPTHLIVPEQGRPIEVMRLAFESADPAIYFDTDARDAWFDAVAAATLETAGC